MPKLIFLLYAAKSVITREGSWYYPARIYGALCVRKLVVQSVGQGLCGGRVELGKVWYAAKDIVGQGGGIGQRLWSHIRQYTGVA